MQLKNVVFDTELKKYPDLRYRINPTEYNTGDTVIICDTDRKAKEWASKGYSCIGMETDERIYSVKYVTDSPECINDEYIYMVYCRHNGIPMTICETKRLMVREMSKRDIVSLYDIYKGNVLKFVEPLYEYEKEVEFTEKYIENMYGYYGYGLWILERKSDRKIIGRAGLSNRNVDGVNEIELGYIIGEEFQQNGYAYEACEAIIRFGFENIGADRIIACIDKNNAPSIGLAHKLKFTGLSSDEESPMLIFYRLRD